MDASSSAAGKGNSLSLALKALDDGQAEQAVQLLQFAATLNPDSFEVHYHLGRAYLACDKLSLAAVSLRRAAEIDPQSSPAWCALGRCLFRQGDFPAARETLEVALRLPDGCPEAQELLDQIPRPEDRAILQQMLGNEAAAPALAETSPRPSRMLLVTGAMGVVLSTILAVTFLQMREISDRGPADAPPPVVEPQTPPPDMSTPASPAAMPGHAEAEQLLQVVLAAQQSYWAENNRYASLEQLAHRGVVSPNVAAGEPDARYANVVLSETPATASTFQVSATLPNGHTFSINHFGQIVEREPAR